MIPSSVLEHTWSHWVGDQTGRLVVSPPPSCTVLGLDCPHSPSAVPLLKHLDTEFTPFLNLAHMLFGENKDKQWRVF